MKLNTEYKNILLAFSDRKVKFLLAGAHAQAVNGNAGSTMDLDLWIMPDPDNAVLVLQALTDFGAPSGYLTAKDLQKEDIVFQVGKAPKRIKILTSVGGLKFKEAFARSKKTDMDGIPVQVLSPEDLKKAG